MIICLLLVGLGWGGLGGNYPSNVWWNKKAGAKLCEKNTGHGLTEK